MSLWGWGWSPGCCVGVCEWSWLQAPGMSPGMPPGLSQSPYKGAQSVLDACPRLSKAPTKSVHHFCTSGASPLPDLGLSVPPAMPVTPKPSVSLLAWAVVAPGLSPPAQRVPLTLPSSSPRCTTGQTTQALTNRLEGLLTQEGPNSNLINHLFLCDLAVIKGWEKLLPLPFLQGCSGGGSTGLELPCPCLGLGRDKGAQFLLLAWSSSPGSPGCVLGAAGFGEWGKVVSACPGATPHCKEPL